MAEGTKRPSKYGQIGNDVPQQWGQTIWVSSSGTTDRILGEIVTGNDGNDGSMLRPLATIEQALVVADVFDVVRLYPGTHTFGASLAMSTVGVSIRGATSHSGRPLSRIQMNVADQVINVTAAGCGLHDLIIEGLTAQTYVDFTSAAEGLWINGCTFDMETPAANLATIGVAPTGSGPFNLVLFENCRFLSDGAQGNGIVATATRNSQIRNCEFVVNVGTWASAVLCGAVTESLLIRDCNFLSINGGTMARGVNGAGATLDRGVMVLESDFGAAVTAPIDAFATADDCEIGLNFQAGIGATDGGTVITATD